MKEPDVWGVKKTQRCFQANEGKLCSWLDQQKGASGSGLAWLTGRPRLPAKTPSRLVVSAFSSSPRSLQIGLVGPTARLTQVNHNPNPPPSLIIHNLEGWADIYRRFLSLGIHHHWDAFPQTSVCKSISALTFDLCQLTSRVGGEVGVSLRSEKWVQRPSSETCGTHHMRPVLQFCPKGGREQVDEGLRVPPHCIIAVVWD